MAKYDFNANTIPKAKTERFKMYVDVGTGSTPELELQGRGIASWTIEQNQDVNQEADVLGYVDTTRGTAKPKQAVDAFKFRKDSKLGKIISQAFITGDMSALDNVTIYQRFDYVDTGTDTEGVYIARKMPNCLININSYNAEAEGDISVSMDIYYTGEIVMGTMTDDTFTPDAE